MSHAVHLWMNIKNPTNCEILVTELHPFHAAGLNMGGPTWSGLNITTHRTLDFH